MVSVSGEDTGRRQVETAAETRRRWAAVLFADVVDSTRISEQIGLEPTYALVQDIFSASWKVIEDHAGETVEYSGDSILAVFGGPVAVENASLNACRAALAMQAQLRAARDRFVARYGVSPEFRIALAGGFVVVGNLGLNSKMQLNVLGGPVNMAARIEALAAPGEILCSASIFDQVEEFVIAEPLGRKDLRGFTESQGVYRLTGLVADLNVFEGRLRRARHDFFGRREELRLLRDWNARIPQAPRTIDLVGAAGIGKSRLLHEFGRTVAPGGTVLTGHCSQEAHAIPLAPVLEIIRQDIGWRRGDDRASVGRRLRERLDGSPRGLDFLVNLVGVFDSPGAASVRDDALSVRAVLAGLLRRLSDDPARVVLIEDIHWIDPTSEELLRGLVSEREHGLRILLTRRPGPAPPWLTGPGVAHMPLGPLGPRHLSRIIATMLDSPEVPEALLAYVARVSEGVPLFAEEMLRYLRQGGHVVVEADGIRFVEPQGTSAVSGNLQHLILSLFDRLDSGTRACLEFAAAKGRRFSIGFVAACAERSSAVQACVDQASAARLIEPDPDGGPGSWRFAHALIAEAIYSGVIGDKRRQIHARVAAALEAEGDDPAREHVEELAFHHEAAGHPREATLYLRKSAEKAFSVYAVDLVDAHLDRAFALIEREPGIVGEDAFGAMLLLWARALDILGSFRKLDAVLAHHLPRLAAHGPSKALAVCLTLRALSRCHAAEYGKSREMIEHAAAVSAAIGDELSIAWTKVARMRIYVDSELEPHRTVARLYDEVRPVAERAGDAHMLQAALYTLQASYRALGSLKKAEELTDALERYGSANNDTRALAYAGWARAILGFCRRDARRLREAAKFSLRHSVPGTADWRVAVVFDLSAPLLEPGTPLDPDAYREHIEHTRASENMTLCNVATMGQCLACFKAGRLHEGWRRLGRATEQVRATGIAETRRTTLLQQAELLLAIAGVKRSHGPRPKLGVRDLVLAARLRLFARRRAERLVCEFLDRAPAPDGFYVAQAYYYLGLIAISRRRHDQALAHLRASHDLYEREGLDALAAEVRAAFPRGSAAVR